MSSEQEEKQRSILVIDDDDVVRELLSALLEVNGYKVLVASSGNEALVLLSQPDPPDWILTDLQMPGLEGEALTSALREAAPACAVLVGMSASRPSPAILRSVDGFLPKPFAAEQIQAIFVAAETARAEHTVREPRLGPATSAASQELDEPVLDEAIFSALARSFQREHLRELYDMTLKDVEARYAHMSELAASGDLAALQREAHAVKGACGFVGARQLGWMAASVERGTTLNTSALAEFPGACTRLRRMLEAKLQQ